MSVRDLARERPGRVCGKGRHPPLRSRSYARLSFAPDLIGRYSAPVCGESRLTWLSRFPDPVRVTRRLRSAPSARGSADCAPDAGKVDMSWVHGTLHHYPRTTTRILHFQLMQIALNISRSGSIGCPNRSLWPHGGHRFVRRDPQSGVTRTTWSGTLSTRALE